jgi:hypothetical protein
MLLFFERDRERGTTTVLQLANRGSIFEVTASGWNLAFNSEKNKTPVRKNFLSPKVLSDLFHIFNSALYELISFLSCCLFLLHIYVLVPLRFRVVLNQDLRKSRDVLYQP